MYLTTQAGAIQRWGIIQKQTGTDRLSIGSRLSAQYHGRGLRLSSIIRNVLLVRQDTDATV